MHKEKEWTGWDLNPRPQLSSSNFISYNAIWLAARRKGVRIDMAFCHTIFPSHLRQSGVEIEIVELLQGMVPRIVFARHYFTSRLYYQEKMIHALIELKKEIEDQLVV